MVIIMDKKSIFNIFRSYDVRGNDKELTPEVIKEIGKAFAVYEKSKNIVVGHDMRLNSPQLNKALIEGLTESGKNVFSIGLVPMGVAMFYAWKNKMTLAYITGSHLPKDRNGVKFFHSNGVGFFEHENFKIRDIFMKDESRKGKGIIKIISDKETIEKYKKYLISKIKPARKIKILVDCGNGMAGVFAPSLFKEAGFDVVSVFENLDGTFPNRMPDPHEDSLTKAVKLSKKTDIGVAYDGDGDRMLILDEKGRKITPSQTSYFILSELLKTVKGPIVANVECSGVIDTVAKKFSRKVIRVPVGHTFLVQGVHKEKAAYGVEESGHFALPFLVPFDDAMAVSYYTACILSKTQRKLSEIADDVPKFYNKRFSYKCPDDVKFKLIDTIKKKFSEKYKKINKLDGVRIDLEEGWVLIRAANTSPIVRITIEAEDEKNFLKLKNIFIPLFENEIKKLGVKVEAEY